MSRLMDRIRRELSEIARERGTSVSELMSEIFGKIKPLPPFDESALASVTFARRKDGNMRFVTDTIVSDETARRMVILLAGDPVRNRMLEERRARGRG